VGCQKCTNVAKRLCSFLETLFSKDPLVADDDTQSFPLFPLNKGIREGTWCATFLLRELLKNKGFSFSERIFFVTFNKNEVAFVRSAAFVMPLSTTAGFAIRQCSNYKLPSVRSGITNAAQPQMLLNHECRSTANVVSTTKEIRKSIK
jgi:hypothetical protein